MYAIKRTDTEQYFSEWSWQDNIWDGKHYSFPEAEEAVLFFNELGVSCTVESAE